jgi:hypothetical protein
MEHKKYNQVLIGLDIISIIEEKVQQWANDYWNEDECPPEFWVSLNNEDENNQSIMISISHLDSKFTERLFPRKDTQYGYNSVINQMISMYNQTM